MESSVGVYRFLPSGPSSANVAPWARLLEAAGRQMLRFAAAHAAARQARATQAELQHLGERELADIGLTRAQVELMGLGK